MGRYIDEILQPGEKVLYSTNLHWIFYWRAIATWIVALVLLVLSRATSTEAVILICLSAAAVVALAALYWTAAAWFDVNQSILGRIFNYGDVTILGVGEGRETIADIASPLAFRNFITAR
jgi:hypothetical protein